MDDGRDVREDRGRIGDLLFNGAAVLRCDAARGLVLHGCDFRALRDDDADCGSRRGGARLGLIGIVGVRAEAAAKGRPSQLCVERGYNTFMRP